MMLQKICFQKTSGQTSDQKIGPKTLGSDTGTDFGETSIICVVNVPRTVIGILVKGHQSTIKHIVLNSGSTNTGNL